LPINLKCAGSFSFGSAGTGMAIALSANSPKRPFLPEACLITPFSTVISPAGTCQASAAACDQHLARGGADLAHLDVGIGDGGRATGALHAERQIGL
jgi:hypothetical protein